MKTHNTDHAHQIDVTRGRKSTNRAGSTGITFRDASTTADDVTDLLVLGGSVIDNDDGTAILQFDPNAIGGPDPAAGVTLYVDAATGDDATGDGTSGDPYASIGRALEDIPTVVTGRYTIDVADGTYREEVHVDRFLWPGYGAGAAGTDARITITGNTTTPANCIISGADSGAPTTPVRNFCIRVLWGIVTIEGFKLQYAVARGIQASHYAQVALGKMEYDNCGDAVLIGTYSLAALTGNQTISNVAHGFYLTVFSRLVSDGGSRTITMTGVTKRGLYIVESTVLLNSGDTYSITAAGSGTREAGIEADGNAVVDIPVTGTISGAFVYGIAAVGGGRVHIATASITVSGFGTAAYYAVDAANIWDTTNSAVIRAAPEYVISAAAFPTNTWTGLRCFRTDLGMEFYYDGTRWLTTSVYSIQSLRRNDGTTATGDLWVAISVTTTTARIPKPLLAGTSQPYIVSFGNSFTVAGGGSALSASHKWVGTVTAFDSAGGSLGTVGTISIDSGASGTFRVGSTTINAVLHASTAFMQVSWAKTGTPGNLTSAEVLGYRLIAT